MTQPENIRPWGRYDVVDVGEGYLVKRIVVGPHQRLSYQRHQQRSERWIVVKGTATVTRDDVDSVHGVGEVIIIDVMMKHRVANAHDAPLVFVEVQLGDYLGEDDIERFSDDYGRSSKTSLRNSKPTTT